jgi:GNAT superfamily N-acetyltransferase
VGESWAVGRETAGSLGRKQVGEKVTEFAGVRFFLMDMASPVDRNTIHEQLRAFNDEFSLNHRAVRESGAKPLDIFIRDGENRLCGGLVGATYWDWLELDYLWLGSALRGRGIGRQLVSMAEAEAVARGCSRVWLRTYDFQARGFYEKLGYRVVGTLEDYPPGGALYWMRKDLVMP